MVAIELENHIWAWSQQLQQRPDIRLNSIAVSSLVQKVDMFMPLTSLDFHKIEASNPLNNIKNENIISHIIVMLKMSYYAD